MMAQQADVLTDRKTLAATNGEGFFVYALSAFSI